MFRPSKFFRFYLILTLGASSIAIAQDQDQPEESTPDIQSQTSPRAIEEITVQGERSIFALRQQIEVAETEVYNLFNELNSNDEFDVTCTEEVFTGSHMKHRVCMAAYLREAQQDHTRDYMLTRGGPVVGAQLTLEEIKVETLQKSAAMEQEMLRVAQEHPDFAEALLRLTSMVGQLELRKKENPLNLDN